MSSRKKIREVDAFDLLNSVAAVDTSVHEIDAELYGVIQQVDANRQSADATDIFEIHPDKSQPRRAIPHKVREAAIWDGELDQIEHLFLTWEEMVNEGRTRHDQPSFNLRQYLDRKFVGNTDIEHHPEADLPDEVQAIEKSLIELIELATSIYSDGLANPITVVRLTRGQYLIETGERRWLAYHLLYWHTRDKKYARIAARTVETLNIWRQAAENNARANLNAISKARQLAMLLMDLRRTDADEVFAPYSQFSYEQGYYAQVADGDKFRIPRGSSERLLNATGLKSGKQLREYRALLRLPRLVWQIADDLNWPERAIRDLCDRALNDDDLVLLAVKKAAAEGYSVPMGTVSHKRSGKNVSQSLVADSVPLVPEDKRYYGYFLQTLRRAKSGKHEEAREQAFEMIAELRRWLEEQENQLSQ